MHHTVTMHLWFVNDKLSWELRENLGGIQRRRGWPHAFIERISRASQAVQRVYPSCDDSGLLASNSGGPTLMAFIGGHLG
jgi:hypothetical protein